MAMPGWSDLLCFIGVQLVFEGFQVPDHPHTSYSLAVASEQRASIPTNLVLRGEVTQD
jgi:hypothetical protein